MLKIKGWLRAAALCMAFCLLLTGCSIPMQEEKVQVEELLRAPRLAGDYGALQTALNDWLGESAQLKYPLQGDLLSPFVLQDFDGDGEQDAAVFYTTALTSNVCVAFLRKNSGGVWQVSQTVEGLADSVDNVRLAQLQAGGTAQLVVGYAASQDDHYLAVYSYENGEVSAILEQAYEQYLVEDITGGGSEDLILMSTLEDSGVQIELLTVDKDGSFQQVAVMALSYNASLRNVPSLVSRDLDGDGTVEIPTQPDEAGLLNMSQSRRMDFIVWMDYTASAPEKSFGLLDEETGCYIALPIEWEGNLMLTDSTDEEDAVELRTIDENKLVLTLRLASSSENAVGWTRLGVVASRQMQAKLGPDVTIENPDYRLSRSLYRLN